VVSAPVTNTVVDLVRNAEAELAFLSDRPGRYPESDYPM
jgi:hypothetical protein